MSDKHDKYCSKRSRDDRRRSSRRVRTGRQTGRARQSNYRDRVSQDLVSIASSSNHKRN